MISLVEDRLPNPNFPYVDDFIIRANDFGYFERWHQLYLHIFLDFIQEMMADTLYGPCFLRHGVIHPFIVIKCFMVA